MIEIGIVVVFFAIWSICCLFCFAILLFVDRQIKKVLQQLVARRKRVNK